MLRRAQPVRVSAIKTGDPNDNQTAQVLEVTKTEVTSLSSLPLTYQLLFRSRLVERPAKDRSPPRDIR